jgi:hypothetical protein
VESEDEVEGEGGDVTFNSESILVEGSRVLGERRFVEQEEAELTGAARDEEDLGVEMERDLDDSVPEAGSYQHTDTEVEDSSSEEAGSDDSPLRDTFPSGARQPPRQTQQQPPSVPSSSARRQGTRSSTRPQAQQGRSRQPFDTPDLTDATTGGAVGNAMIQDRFRAATAAVADASLTRSPGSLNLSSSLLESSFVSSSPVMQRNTRGRGGRRRGGTGS